MRTTKLTCLALAAALALTLWGCGSSRDSGGSTTGQGTTLADAQPLGIDNCLTCHQGSLAAPGAADTWFDGVHSNGDSSPNGLTDPTCLACHDQLGDGATLTPARPVVSCESCHGGGQFHNGIAAGIPFPKPGSAQCGECHNATFPHGFSPEGVGITEDFEESPHAASLNSHVFEGTTTDVRARCSKCHSDEGAKQYLTVDGDYAFLTANLPSTLAPLTNASAISCRTCHSPHDESTLLEAATANRSAQFNTCTNCHQLVKNDLTKIDAYHDPAVNAFGAFEEIITDTHFATAGNFVSTNTNDITGYAMDFSDERVCLNCHNPHNANTEINTQWAESKHADTTALGAWAHYNWTETPGDVRNDGSVVPSYGDRGPCQRCHTTRGYIKMAEETAGDTSAFVPFDDFQPSYKPEMLHCNGCHTDSLGGLRPIDAVKVQYTNVPAVTSYPDSSSSNICIACHTGRESGESIVNSAADFTSTGFINSHYLTAGGTVFGTTGYPYGARDYTIPAEDTHVLIGTGTTGNAAVDTYTGGPCVTCHFSSNDGSHTLSPFTQYTADDEALNPVCVNCHSSRGEGSDAAFAWFGVDFTVADLVAGEVAPHKGRYLAGLEALRVLLAANGYTFTPNYPYFANTDWTVGVSAVGKDNMGAAFNYNLLVHDPGGVAHNRRYTRRLMYDSIDHMDNGLLDYSVATTLNALADTVTYKASAISYLLKAQNGDAGDRH